MKALPLEGHHLPKASPRWVLRCFPQPLWAAVHMWSVSGVDDDIVQLLGCLGSGKAGAEWWAAAHGSGFRGPVALLWGLGCFQLVGTWGLPPACFAAPPSLLWFPAFAFSLASLPCVSPRAAFSTRLSRPPSLCEFWPRMAVGWAGLWAELNSDLQRINTLKRFFVLADVEWAHCVLTAVPWRTEAQRPLTRTSGACAGACPCRLRWRAPPPWPPLSPASPRPWPTDT